MFRRWLRRRRLRIVQVQLDAESLIVGFGALAYNEAKRRARDARGLTILDANRDSGHWERVGREIARLTHRDIIDTATRYLGE